MNEKLGDRKSQIIVGAFNALKKKGLPDLSYDTVAEESGLSRQLIRYHFPDHEALMIAVCDYLAGLYREALITNAGQLEGAARVEMFLDFYFDLLSDSPKPRDDQVYDAMFSLAARSTPVRKALVGQYSLLGQILSHEFELQFEHLDRQAAQELSYIFVSLMYGHWKMVASLGFTEEHKKIARHAMTRLIRSYEENGFENAHTVRVWETN